LSNLIDIDRFVSPLCYLQQQGGDFFCLAFDDDLHSRTSSRGCLIY
jgi:hypothetical protein